MSREAGREEVWSGFEEENFSELVREEGEIERLSWGDHSLRLQNVVSGLPWSIQC